MARFMTLTSSESPSEALAVNLDNVAWMSMIDTGTMIFFTVAPHYEQPPGELASIKVSETLNEIRQAFQGLGDKAGQAWSDSLVSGHGDGD
jgi:hypothetical protein